MSTKGLMAHKRVAEVTLNEAGKAATLTLAPGWLFEGSRGPFTLTNVEHGHTIVKSATSDGSVPLSVRKPVLRSLATTDGPLAKENTDPDYVPVRERPVDPRTDETFVYRLSLVPKGEKLKREGQQVFGWYQCPRELSDNEIISKTWEQLASYHGKDITMHSHEAVSFRWTNAHQELARKNNEIGSPWAGRVNHG